MVEACSRCAGSGKIIVFGSVITCHVCKGTGRK